MQQLLMLVPSIGQLVEEVIGCILVSLCRQTLLCPFPFGAFRVHKDPLLFQIAQSSFNLYPQADLQVGCFTAIMCSRH
jgi:hypothetical protein